MSRVHKERCSHGYCVESRWDGVLVFLASAVAQWVTVDFFTTKDAKDAEVLPRDVRQSGYGRGSTTCKRVEGRAATGNKIPFA